MFRIVPVTLLVISCFVAFLPACLGQAVDHMSGDKAWANLIGHKWLISSNWPDGSPFRQIIEYEASLQGKLITTLTYAQIDPESEELELRNQGYRHRDMESGKYAFVEHDIFGGNTTGIVTLDGMNLYYEYDYEGQTITDAWIYEDESTYEYIVGVRNGESWGEIYMNTKATKIMNKITWNVDDQGNPYAQIPQAPGSYNAANVLARTVDGLGFRYYWATYDLRPEDLAYRVSETSRTSAETLDHIYGLCEVVQKTVQNEVCHRPLDVDALSWDEKRAGTLAFLAEASKTLRTMNDNELAQLTIRFARGEKVGDPYPLWNLLNGPLADALWHTGQIVSNRRASGNPLPAGVSVFSGTRRTGK